MKRPKGDGLPSLRHQVCHEPIPESVRYVSFPKKRQMVVITLSLSLSLSLYLSFLEVGFSRAKKSVL
jgi:hypothetical protein